MSLCVTGCHDVTGGIEVDWGRSSPVFFMAPWIRLVSGYEWLLFFHDFGEQWDGILIVEHVVAFEMQLNFSGSQSSLFDSVPSGALLQVWIAWLTNFA